ncbi:protein-arginine deiminase family protein [Sorangium sp. So ce854]|uniref:protein-arginine deiminase family protein n=1 Tax=Sorangium sp. So ce854 TaxID=3133322 RepID=UPI003F646840
MSRRDGTGRPLRAAPARHHAPRLDTSRFEEEMRAKVNPLGFTLYFLDGWCEYHVQLGEVHCGTNTLRTTTSARWWECTP